jgi:predicted dehydrogenase
MNIAIIGYGYWGPNLLRNFSSVKGCKVHTLCDLRVDRLQSTLNTYPFLHLTDNVEEVFQNNEIDAIVIATPVNMHYPLAKKALEHGKHVLIEKPMTTSVKDAEHLIELAEKNKKVLMVDHTFLYTGSVQKMKSLVQSNEIGNIKYLDSTRINLGLFQSDVNVLWDLAPHDISICDYLMNEKPYSVQATGISHTQNGIENIAYLTLNYQSNIIAHFNCSWTSPVKIRQMLVGGDKKMIVFNDIEPSEKIKIYDTGYNYKNEEEKSRVLVDYRIGDVFIPKLDSKEALGMMANDFVNAIQTGQKPISDSSLSLAVVRILEASQVSIKNNGKEVKITQ